MFKTIGNFIFLAASGITFIAAITGKDIGGLPASIDRISCGHLAKTFAQTELTRDGHPTKIMYFSDLAELGRSDDQVICRAFASFDVGLGTFVRLQAQKVDGKTQSDVSPARPEDYTCDLLGQELALKLSGQPFGAYGTLLNLSNTEIEPNTAPLHCVGMANFSGGGALPMRYSYDGKTFEFH